MPKPDLDHDEKGINAGWLGQRSGVRTGTPSEHNSRWYGRVLMRHLPCICSSDWSLF